MKTYGDLKRVPYNVPYFIRRWRFDQLMLLFSLTHFQDFAATFTWFLLFCCGFFSYCHRRR